jgi:hypothetical protein
MTTLLKKIAASDLLGPVAKLVKDTMEVGETRNAFAVAGVCNKIEEGVSQYGEWVRFLGDFNAINYFTGENFRSAKTHVPKVLEDVLIRDLQGLKGSVKELQNSTVTDLTTEIEFAFVVALKRCEDDAKGGVQYEYVTTPKTEVKANDRISHLTALIAEPPERVLLENKKSKK